MQEEVLKLRKFLEDYIEQPGLSTAERDTIDSLVEYFGNVSDKLLTAQLQDDDAMVNNALKSMSIATEAANAAQKNLGNVADMINKIANAANALSKVATIGLKYI